MSRELLAVLDKRNRAQEIRTASGFISTSNCTHVVVEVRPVDFLEEICGVGNFGSILYYCKLLEVGTRRDSGMDPI